jgi:hypothetical protein
LHLAPDDHGSSRASPTVRLEFTVYDLLDALTTKSTTLKAASSNTSAFISVNSVATK